MVNDVRAPLSTTKASKILGVLNWNTLTHTPSLSLLCINKISSLDARIMHTGVDFITSVRVFI